MSSRAASHFKTMEAEVQSLFHIAREILAFVVMNTHRENPALVRLYLNKIPIFSVPNLNNILTHLNSGKELESWVQRLCCRKARVPQNIEPIK